MAWYFYAASTPTNLTQSGAATAFRNAANHITGAYNNCSLADNVGATNSYLGYTSKAQNISSTGGCGARDGVSVVGFRGLPSGYLAVTCWWSMNGATIEADMALNKAYYKWYTTKPSTCSSMWDTETTATHEFGHAFGLAHVSQTYHPTLTMHPVMMACQQQERTLGLGDIRGLEYLY
jgi:hypothetical protein